MTLKDRLERDLTDAIKSRDAMVTSVLRLVIAALKNEELAGRGALDEARVAAVLGTQCKQRRESIEAFEKGGRADLADKERRELTILSAYLPPPLSEAELASLVDQAIAETGATSAKDMGRVMKAVMVKAGGRADGGTINALVRTKLS